MSSIPIRAAYEHHGAVRRPCPQCGAGPNRWCVNTAGRLRRVPLRPAGPLRHPTPAMT